MKFIQLFLVGYVVLVIGGLLALWRSGMLARIPAVWTCIGLVIAVGLGIMMAVSSGKPGLTSDK